VIGKIGDILSRRIGITNVHPNTITVDASLGRRQEIADQASRRRPRPLMRESPNEAIAIRDHPFLPNEATAIRDHPFLPNEATAIRDHPFLPNEATAICDHPFLPNEAKWP
jgi:hypothetical protein